MPIGLVRPVQREQHQAGDDGRQRERKVDQRVDHPLAGELVAHEHPRDERAHHHVDDGDASARGNDRQLERGEPPQAW